MEVNLGNISVPVIVPQRGVDYWTASDKQEVVTEAVNAVNAVVMPQEQTRQNNEITRQTNETSRESAEQTRQSNETTRQSNESTRGSNETTRQTNETVRQSNEATRQANETSRTSTFNQQMLNVDTAIQEIHTSQTIYDENATAKTNAFNTNATEKTTAFNTNATSKTTDYNTNAQNKIEAYNTNATEKIAEYDAHVSEITTDIANIKSEQTTQNTNIQANATAISNIKDGTTIDSFGDVETALNGKEDVSNKVTSISSSSTDTQYPSAKCVYDIVGDIESILEELDIRRWC